MSKTSDKKNLPLEAHKRLLESINTLEESNKSGTIDVHICKKMAEALNLYASISSQASVSAKLEGSNSLVEVEKMITELNQVMQDELRYQIEKDLENFKNNEKMVSRERYIFGIFNRADVFGVIASLVGAASISVAISSLLGL